MGALTWNLKIHDITANAAAVVRRENNVAGMMRNIKT
jgi:hypothetical protein